MLAMFGGASSLVLEQRPGAGVPLWRHWGARLGQFASPTRSTPSFSPDVDHPLTIFPCFGNGWFGQSALLGHRQGRDFQQAFDQTGIAFGPDGSREIELFDHVAQLRVTIRLALDAASDILTIHTELRNEGADAFELQFLAAATLMLPGTAETVHGFVGRHLDEFHPVAHLLDRFGWQRENRRGLTSHDAFPGAIVALPGATEHGGEVFAAHLAWSGNHRQVIDWVDDGRYLWMLGEWLAPGEMILAPGQSYRSPDVIALFSAEGLNGIARGFHQEIRKRVRFPGDERPRPVTINTWEGFYFRHDVGRLMTLADKAAAIGAERFVLDDGWFRHRDDDTRGLGDWEIDARKYPDGLDPLIAHVNALGMEFGLWVEPEMANPDSDLLRAHPDWALQVQGRPKLTARNQLVLDMARPEVVAHMFDRLSSLLTRHNIAYLKWDHNRDLAPAAGPDGKPRYHAQVQAVYALLARLRAEFPGVEIESCAGGGGRIDAGILRYTHRVWTSDNIDARSRLPIQRNFLRFFPPEIMGAHVGTAPAHTTQRSQSLDFRAAVALPGHFGMEFDLDTLTDGDSARLAEWVALHKRLRGTLHGSQVWQGDGQDGIFWQAHGDAARGPLVILAYRLDPAAFRHPPPLRLPFMQRHTQAAGWRVTMLHPLSQEWGVHDPAVLAGVGLPMPQLSAEAAAIFACRIDDDG